MQVAIGLLLCLTIVFYVAPVGGRKVRKRCKPLEFADVTSDCNKDPNADGWYPDGTVCTFQCRTGCVKDVGGTRRVCKVKGRSKWWTGGRGLRCKCKPCEDAPPTIPNTVGPDCTSPYEAGDTCNYQCAPGYTKEGGNNDKTCVNGKWKGEDLMCAVEDADECSSTPCQNGGTCTAGDSSYTCECVDGYTGDNCETDIDDCAPNPCNNSGNCTDGVNSYTCDCEDGFAGDNCEIVVMDGNWATWLSWGSCGVSCGGGVQTRTRTCDNPPPTIGGADCVGHPSQTRPCNEWQCPDCMRICAVGSLNAACDACTCDGHVLNGHVTDTRRVPLGDAEIRYAENPSDVVAYTDAMGDFTVTGACSQGVDIIVRRVGYFEAHATSTQQDAMTSYVRVNMTALVPPIITGHPQSKKRLVGQDVTFCCAAHGNPPISSYEWFKDGLVLDEDVYGYNDTLTIENLAVDDSGVYRCRANSDAGSKYSDEATLEVEAHSHVKDWMSPHCPTTPDSSPDRKTWLHLCCKVCLVPPTTSVEDNLSSCPVLPVENLISLPDDCVQEDTNSTGYDIGSCGGDDCVGDLGGQDKMCVDTKRFCCVPTSTETRTVYCSGYSLNVTVTTACGCGSCVKTFTKRIQGRAYGVNRTNNASTEVPLTYGAVIMDGQVVDYTSETGMFEFTTETTASKISLTFRDYFKILVTSTRVLSLTGSDTLNFDVILKLRPPPVTIMATETSVLDLGTVEGSVPVAEIDIPANSFFTREGNLFEGEVKASVSFIDPRNEEDFEFIQGELTAVDVEGQENTMQTFGMFTMDFETDEGDDLELGANLTVHIDPSESNIDTNDVDENGNLRTKIWTLDSDSGLWQDVGNLRVGTASRRRKRYDDWRGCYSTGADNHFAFVNTVYQPYVFPPYTFDPNQYSQPITVTSWYPNENELKKVSDVVRNENTVEFTVPNGNDFGRDYGTYVKTGSGYTGYGEALEYCRSGSDTGGTGKPLVYNKYHAIRFNCGDNFEFTTERPGVVTEAGEDSTQGSWIQPQ
ncbi:hypothetical protein Bbelb_056470 [Branchiostoma belcheri]|nr:hypothetical protein Bbelb_056470 [Branchiostoma belcheri]